MQIISFMHLFTEKNYHNLFFSTLYHFEYPALI